MEVIKQYDSVLVRAGKYGDVQLKENTRGCAVEVFGDGECCIVDIGSSPVDWETIDVRRDDIIEIIYDR